jgi:galactokinase
MSEIVVQAPARVNIIGEHTDHNGGFVLPTTTALFTRVSATPRSDGLIAATSHHFNESQSFFIEDIQPADEVSWIEYIKGVAAELLAEGVALSGMTLEIDSDIPIGGGLSSSASLELSVAKAMVAGAGAELDAPQLAKICQRAERRFAKVQCGIMDQYAIACSRKGHAVALDCRSLEAEQVPIPAQARFIIIDSGVRHRLPDGDYNNRTDECAEAVALLGIEMLRDLDIESLEQHRELLGDVLYRRCRHVVTENHRVLASVAALHQSDLVRLGGLLDQCQHSLRDDFEISCDEIDSLVGLANNCDGVLGSRMVGGGFGGCVLSLTTSDCVASATSQITDAYNASFGRSPWMHVVEPADPAMEIPPR